MDFKTNSNPALQTINLGLDNFCKKFSNSNLKLRISNLKFLACDFWTTAALSIITSLWTISTFPFFFSLSYFPPYPFSLTATIELLHHLPSLKLHHLLKIQQIKSGYYFFDFFLIWVIYFVKKLLKIWCLFLQYVSLSSTVLHFCIN